MATELKMPQLSDTMNDGKILSWKKREGDSVSRGDALAEVETDKANLEIECFQQGTLLKILVQAGQKAKVGEVIAVIGSPGESVADSGGSGKAAPQQSVPAPSAGSAPTPKKDAPPSAPQTHALSNGHHATPVQASPSESGRIKASPLARKLAEQSNVDLSSISGSGPAGRILKKDIEAAQSRIPSSPRYAASQEAPQPAASRSQAVIPPSISPASSPQTGTAVGGGRMTPLSKMRETIARRMQQAVAEAPHFYVTTAIDMTQVSRLRELLKERPEFKGISVNHFVIKAAAYALALEPRVNCAMKDGQVFQPEGINVGIITAVEDGLLIPVVRDADKLTLKDLVFEARAAVERARAGRPTSSDLTGGTFSISNMGMFDVENFTAIINPGQGAVLAVSATKEVPVVRNGQVVPGLQMKVTLSVDHRIIDGVMGAQFLKHFKEGLENPALLMGPL